MFLLHIVFSCPDMLSRKRRILPYVYVNLMRMILTVHVGRGV